MPRKNKHFKRHRRTKRRRIIMRFNNPYAKENKTYTDYKWWLYSVALVSLIVVIWFYG